MLSFLKSGGLVVLALACAVANAQDLDAELAAVLESAGFTGTVGSSIQARLGRPIDPKLANLGRLLFFDKIPSLHDDNACAGCHSPTNGFGDTQSIAIGIQNDNLVGPNCHGPRNQRRTPMVSNTPRRITTALGMIGQSLTNRSSSLGARPSELPTRVASRGRPETSFIA